MNQSFRCKTQIVNQLKYQLTMEKILTEDQCIGNNLDFKFELSKLINAGYVLVHQYMHPAVGQVAVLQMKANRKGLGNF